MTIFVYSLLSGLLAAVMWAAYRLSGLRRRTHFRLNRVILMLIPCIALLLPVYTLRYTPKVPELTASAAVEAPSEPTAGAKQAFVDVDLPVQQVVSADSSASAASTGHDGLVFLPIVSRIYLIGMALCALWLISGLIGILFTICHGRRVRIEGGATAIIVSRSVSPFTWGRWVIISEADWAERREMILAHECAHIRAAHWVDLLISRLFACLCWYWPTVWLMHRDLAEAHEYEADREVINSGVPSREYQMLLINSAAASNGIMLCNPLFYKPLKNRIVMMKKKQSSRRSGWLCLVMMPAVAMGALFATTPSVASTVQGWIPVPSAEPTETAEPAEVSEPAVAVQPVAENEAPQFPGEPDAMYKWINENLRYPERAFNNNVQGRVIVQFLVKTDGAIDSVKVVRSVDPDLDAEAVRVVKAMPKFIPGKINGEVANVWYTLPLTFRLAATVTDAKKDDALVGAWKMQTQNGAESIAQIKIYHKSGEFEVLFPVMREENPGGKVSTYVAAQRGTWENVGNYTIIEHCQMGDKGDVNINYSISDNELTEKFSYTASPNAEYTQIFVRTEMPEHLTTANSIPVSTYSRTLPVTGGTLSTKGAPVKVVFVVGDKVVTEEEVSKIAKDDVENVNVCASPSAELSQKFLTAQQRQEGYKVVQYILKK